MPRTGSLHSLASMQGDKVFPNCKKSNLHYTRDISTKRVTSGVVSLRDLDPGQHSCSEEMSLRQRAAGDAVSDLTGSVIKPNSSCTDSISLSLP